MAYVTTISKVVDFIEAGTDPFVFSQGALVRKLPMVLVHHRLIRHQERTSNSPQLYHRWGSNYLWGYPIYSILMTILRATMTTIWGQNPFDQVNYQDLIQMPSQRL